MTDGRTSAIDTDGEPEPSTDDGNGREPGGGPRRVVSEKSVDDILESLNDTKDGADADDAHERTRLDGDYVETTNDEAEIEATPDDGAGDRESQSAAVGASATETDEIPDEDSGAALADRIEQGTVTGADVRAAEAGDGRDETPAIDEVELTMDDLETSTTTDSARTGERPGSDDSPLTETVEDTESESSVDDRESESGFLARLRRLFGG